MTNRAAQPRVVRRSVVTGRSRPPGARLAIVAVLAACSGSPPRPTYPAPAPPPPQTLVPLRAEVRSPQITEMMQPHVPDEAARAHMQVHLIDVGQGAATLLEFSCGAVLIDTGGEMNEEFNSNEHLMGYLETFFQRRSDLNATLDLLLITHPHIDHARGIKSVWDTYHVKNVVTNGQTSGSGGVQQANLIKWAKKAKIGVEAIKARSIPAEGLTDDIIDPIACGDTDPDIRVLWGAVNRSEVRWKTDPFDNPNNHSVVVKVTFGAASLLITGDLMQDGIAALLGKHAAALDADVYEVGHHGAENATSEALLQAITPKIAIIAMGASSREVMWTAWKYGHPRQNTIELLEHELAGPPRAELRAPVATGAEAFSDRVIRAPIFATGWDGDVNLTLFADGGIGLAHYEIDP